MLKTKMMLEFTSKLLGSLLKKVYVAQNGLEGLNL